MTTPIAPFAPFLDDAAARYAAQVTAARDQQISSLTAQLAASQALLAQDEAQLADAKQQLAAVQTQLSNALANDAADRATIAAGQKAIADLQAQLYALQPGKAPAPPPGWLEAFRDDFNGKVGPGWTIVNNDSSSNELSQRLAANVVPSADRVSIVAKRQTVGTKQFTSGYMTTAGHASWPFFRALVRARWDDLFGIWPAVPWFRFDNAPGEIDGAEAVGTVRKIVQTAHQNTSGAGDRSGYEWAMPAGWSPSDFHIYGTERLPDGTITWTIDGQVTRKIRPTDLSTKFKLPMPWLLGPEYAGPAHLIINLQVGGTMPNYFINGDSTKPVDPAKILPGSTTANLDVDWVQVLTPAVSS